MACGRGMKAIDVEGENCTSGLVTDAPAVLGGSGGPDPKISVRIIGNLIGAVGDGRYRRVADAIDLSDLGQHVDDRVFQRYPPGLRSCTGWSC